eukprot:1737019-Rhodomonas_salina.2
MPDCSYTSASLYPLLSAPPLTYAGTNASTSPSTAFWVGSKNGGNPSADSWYKISEIPYKWSYQINENVPYILYHSGARLFSTGCQEGTPTLPRFAVE